MAGVLRVVLGDQLSPGVSALRDLAAGDTVLMAEVLGECTYVRHHAKKLVLVLSAMRHFAAALEKRGVHVDYVRLDAAHNTQSLRGEVVRAVRRHRSRRVVATEPGEWRVLEDMRGWQDAAGCEVEIRPDDRFLCSISGFRAWAAEKRQLRMEFFYREMRRLHRVLMQGEDPVGEHWNFDIENRKRLPAGVALPALPAFEPDDTTHAVMRLVGERFPEHIGSVEGFAFAVTAEQAEAALTHFLRYRLSKFGDWQDAMRNGHAFLFHSVLSPALNLGLLDPLDICRRAESEWWERRAGLNAVEGFIRQILGWREFMRGIYWLHMPGYATLNALGATRRLPDFYWSGRTHMRCMADAIGQTVANAYSHHIQRLMVTGNFALLAGIDPAEVDEWYLAVYADAYEWVEMPNTRGMALFADGGIVGSKPYAASGAYIDRMSDHCGACAYDVKDAAGARGCPFTALYWDFIGRHAERLARNPRMAMPLRAFRAMPSAKRSALLARAAALLGRLDAGDAI
jgi:deoxyribodipyrimidine photolyase-related protein